MRAGGMAAWRALALGVVAPALVVDCGAESPPAPGDAWRPAPVRKGEAERPLDAYFGRVSPAADAEEWAAEAFAEKAAAVFAKVDAALARGAAADLLGEVAASGFSSGPLRPGGATVVHADATLTVRRGEVASEPTGARGAAGLSEALRSWLGAYPPGTEVHTKFKIVHVEISDGGAVTRAFVQSSGTTPTGIAQQSATWTCRWEVSGDGAPRLAGLTVSDYEEVVPGAGRSGAAVFADAAPAVLGGTGAWRKLLVHGLDHWFRRVDAGFQIAQGYHGVCVRDVDGDDREDVFLCQPAGIRNLLFRRRPDGTLTEVSAAAGLDHLDNTRSALFVDLDNDGDADAVVTLGDDVVMLENGGRGTFRERATVRTASWLMSMAAADFDNDGLVDLHLCGYSPRDATAAGDLLANPVPYHDADNGARNFLLRNEGGFRFADVTGPSGMDVNNRKFTNASAWEDFDDDGDQDLFCANDFGRKNLYRNDLIRGGKRQERAVFVDVAEAADVTDLGAGMSVAWGDWDRDGRMDPYVANMFSSAGRRIASQRHFKASESEATREGLLRLARGNTLFRNRGDGTFEDVAENSGTVLGRWAWASLFADFNNDGWEDLHVCNGFYTRSDIDDL